MVDVDQVDRDGKKRVMVIRALIHVPSNAVSFDSLLAASTDQCENPLANGLEIAEVRPD